MPFKTTSTFLAASVLLIGCSYFGNSSPLPNTENSASIARSTTNNLPSWPDDKDDEPKSYSKQLMDLSQSDCENENEKCITKNYEKSKDSLVTKCATKPSIRAYCIEVVNIVLYSENNYPKHDNLNAYDSDKLLRHLTSIIGYFRAATEEKWGSFDDNVKITILNGMIYDSAFSRYLKDRTPIQNW